LAIECKSLSSDAPLLVSRVPRPSEDTYHELLHSCQRQNMRDKLAQILRPEGSRGIYRTGDPTGKRTAQVCRLSSGAFKDDDRDSYEKPALPEMQSYRISHLHIYTRTGFAAFVQDFSRPGRVRERMFEFGLQQLCADSDAARSMTSVGTSLATATNLGSGSRTV
jgi:hypothetical protein